MTVERPRERGLVLLGTPVEDRLRRELCRDECLVHTVARQRIDEPRRVPDEEHATRRRARPEPTHRQPMAANVREIGRLEPVCTGKAPEVVPEGRALFSPTTDANVRVVSFREDPAVTAGYDAELDPGRPLERLRVEPSPGRVPFERDPADDLVADPDGLRDDAVRPVGSDEVRR